MDSNTVNHPVSDREIAKTEDVQAWANKEAIPVLRELRSFANQEQVQGSNTLTPGDGQWQNLWVSDPVPTGVAMRVIADVIGVSSADWVCYRRVAFFRNVDGSVAQVGPTEPLWSLESSGGPDVRLQVVGQTVTLDVQDDGANSFEWHAMVRVFATPRP